MSERPTGVVTRFSHIVINVADLDRSVDFYEAATTLRRDVEVHAPLQSMETLGIERGEFDGYLLRDPAAATAPGVLLVDWRSPVSVGAPYSEYTHLGWFRMSFADPDANVVYDRVIAAGGAPFTAPKMLEGQDPTGQPVFATRDPDGVVFQCLSLPGPAGFYHVNCNCSDLARSKEFYEALGLRPWLSAGSDQAMVEWLGAGHDAGYDAVMFDHADAPDADPTFTLDLCSWRVPEPGAGPYATQTNLGIARVGFEVDDLQQAATRLGGLGHQVSAIEQRDLGEAIGIRSAVVVRDPDGVVIELVDRAV